MGSSLKDDLEAHTIEGETSKAAPNFRADKGRPFFSHAIAKEINTQRSTMASCVCRLHASARFVAA